MTPSVYLTAVDLIGGWALTASDQVVPIHKMYDGEGKPTRDPSRAVTFTAGADMYIYPYAVSEIVARVLH